MSELRIDGAKAAVTGRRFETALGIFGLMALISAFWPAALFLGGSILRSLPPWVTRERALARGTTGQLRVDRDGLHIAAIVVPRDRIESGWVELLGDAAVVVLQLHNQRTMVIRVPDRQIADKVLETLQLAPSQRAVQMPLASSVVSRGMGVRFHVATLFFGGSMVLGLLAAAVAQWIQHGVGGGIAGAFLVAVAALLVRSYWSVSRAGAITIGSDGFRVRSRSEERFVRYADVVSIRRGAGDALALTLRHGRALTLRAGTMLDGNPALLDAIEERLRTAREAWRDRQRAADRDAAQLDVPAQNVGELKEKLRIAIGEGDYRRATLETDQVTAVLEDDGVSAKRRLTAAVALLDEDEGKQRVERVRARIADPHLGRALDAALSDRLRDDHLARLEAEAIEDAAAAERRT